MNSLTISSLIFTITSLSLAVFIAYFATNKVQRIWAFFNFLVAWWGAGLAVLSLCKNAREAHSWWVFATIGGILIPPAIYHFSAEFTNWKDKKFLWFAYIQAIIVYFYYSFGMIGYHIELLPEGYFYVRIDNWTYHVITAGFFACSFRAMYLLYLSIRKSDTQKALQTTFLLVALSISISSGCIFHFFSIYGFNPSPYWNLPITVYSFVVTYCIFKHQLLDFNLTFKKGIIYTILLSIITVIYFVLLLLIEKIAQTSIGYNAYYSSLFLIVAILISEPLRLKIQSTVDNVFFKGSLEKIAHQNELLHSEIQKQDKLKAISTLAAGMAHEIKNPITVIKTFTEHLPKKSNDPAYIEKFTHIVSAELDKISGTVKQLLEFSKPAPGSYQALHVNQLLDETLQFLTSQLVSKSITLKKDLQGMDLKILGDKKQLGQVFLNIILNAIDAMPGGGVLNVDSRLKPAGMTDNSGLVIISIRDTGIGIPKENLDRIFDPFFTSKDTGTGLGLSIVYGIIKEHGATISVESAIGQGTVFKFMFRSVN